MELVEVLVSTFIIGFIVLSFLWFLNLLSENLFDYSVFDFSKSPSIFEKILKNNKLIFTKEIIQFDFDVYSHLINSTLRFKKKYLFSYINKNYNFILVYKNRFFKKSLRLYKNRINRNLDFFIKLDLEEYNIYAADIRQALALFSSNSILKLLFPYRNQVKLKISKNQIILNFEKEDFLLEHDFYNLLYKLAQSFHSVQSIDYDQLYDNFINDPSDDIKTKNLLFLLNQEMQIISQLHDHQIKRPGFYAIILNRFEQEGLDFALKTVLNEIPRLTLSTCKTLLEKLDQAGVEKFLKKLAQFDLSDIVNSYIISKCQLKEQSDSDTLINLIYNNEIDINSLLTAETAASLIHYFGELRITKSLYWLISKINFNYNNKTDEVLKAIAKIGHHQAIAFLDKIINNHQKKMLYLSFNKDLIQKIKNTIEYLKVNDPQDDLSQQGALSFTDLESSGGLSIPEEAAGGLSVIVNDNKETRKAKNNRLL